MDRTLDCGSGNEGPIPSGGTIHNLVGKFIFPPRISTDRMQTSEACDRGPIPRGGTSYFLIDLARRDFLRAAVFFLIIPLLTALSIA